MQRKINTPMALAISGALTVGTVFTMDYVGDIKEELTTTNEQVKSLKKKKLEHIETIDKLNDEGIMKAINDYKDLFDFAEIIPISALKNDNVDRLISVLKSKLTDNIKYYDDETWTNVSTRFLMSELIREKILELTDEEVPHSVSVIVDQIEYNNNV